MEHPERLDKAKRLLKQQLRSAQHLSKIQILADIKETVFEDNPTNEESAWLFNEVLGGESR